MNKNKYLTSEFIYGGNVAGFSDLHTYINESGAFLKTPQRKRSNWDRTIFCIVDNADLEHAIQKCAGEIKCKVLFDWPTSPELIFDHHFVAVVEAGAVDSNAWDLYVEFCNNGDISVPCLLVGNSEQLEMPKTKNVIHFDLNIQESIQHVVSAIKTIKNNIVSISLI